MYSLHAIPVFQETYTLYQKLHDAVKTFPKGDRYSVGSASLTATLAMLTAIIKAANAKKEWKIPHIDDALLQVELCKVHVRLAYETGACKEAPYLTAQEKLQTIGRMLGGWRRSL